MHNSMMDFIFKIDWSGIINPGISILEKAIRSLAIYFFLLLGFRIAGKRELAQLNYIDIVFLFLLSNTVQNALIGNDNSLIGGLVGAAILFIINYVVVRFVYFNNEAEEVFEGTSSILIEDGIIKHDELEKELITVAELEMAAHKQGFESLDEILKAEMDPDGTFIFVPKKPTPHEEHYEELLSRIDNLTQEVISLKKQLQKDN